ncbi:MAG TPA: substrate-binding domain-containing protein [Bacteroidales bacterium]|nr:substrate-binding domain-containing protein [Bacteroidales bacterium]
MKNLNIKNIVWFTIIVIAFFSCTSRPAGQSYKETATRGDIKIAVDEAYQLLADSQITTFEALYKYANIAPIYASEDSILKLFLEDSVRLMITNRELTANELAYLKEKLIIPRTTKIAYDAIAFILNKSNSDTLIRYNTLRDIFKGDVTSWKMINSASKLGDVSVVFDNQGSGNLRAIMKKFQLEGSLPEYCYSAKSNPDVISYVENHPEAIGLISVNWISDRDDSVTHNFLNRVKVAAISSELFSEGDEFFRPHPAYIADKSYPFIRDVYAISRETFTGLGRGFIQFVAGDQGQRIVLKMGMLPATMPIRLVQIEKE